MPLLWSLCCMFYKSDEKMQGEESIHLIDPAALSCIDCRYNKVESFIKSNPDVNGEARDIEELGRLGPCPFYLSRDMASTAEIVFMPYNYLVDGKIRGGLKMINWQNAVLIFDEAHNLEVQHPYVLLHL